MDNLLTFEALSLAQKNAPAIDGVNSSKPRKSGGKPSLYNQNVDDNPPFDAVGSGDGAGGGGVPMAGGNTQPNVAAGTGHRGSSDHLGGNAAFPGAMGSTPMTKEPTEDDKDGIAVPLQDYTKKGITGDKYYKTGYVENFISKFETNNTKTNIILKFTEYNG